VSIKRKDIFLSVGVFSIILSAFILSVVIRGQYLNQPLGDGHEWLTAQTLRAQQIWYENGAWAHRFLQIETYQNDADKNINNHACVIDKKGNYYYTSYPPFCIILPYLIFRIFNIYPDVLPLEIFNIAVHFICCLFIYWIISFITRKDYLDRLNKPALIGMGVYLFAPESLMFHSTVYYADILVQLFFLMGIYFFLRVISDSSRKSDYVLFGIINLLMIYTEWLGVFFAFAVAVYSFLTVKKKGMRVLLLTVFFTSLAALGLIVWQYSQINGVSSLVNTLLEAYQRRNGISQTADYNLTYWNIASWSHLVSFYRQGYLPFLFFISSLGLFYFLNIKNKFFVILGQDKTYFVALYLCFLPIILHHLVLFNHYVVHDFSVLKDGILISLLIAFFYHKIFVKVFCVHAKFWEICFIISFISAIIGSMNMYSQRCSVVTHKFMDIGKQISRIANKDDVVFMITTSSRIKPQLVFYAHRNIALWKDPFSARKLLIINKSKRGIIFYFNKETDRCMRYTYTYL